MLTSQVMDLINDLEKRFPVASWKVGGIEVWPLLRIRMGFDLFNSHHAAAAVPPPRAGAAARLAARVRKVSAQLKAAQADPEKKLRPGTPCDALFLSDGVSFTKVQGLWYERFCDPLLDTLEREGYRTALITPADSYLVPRKTPSKFIQAQLDSLQSASTLAARLGAKGKVTLPRYQEAADYLRQLHHGASLPSRESLCRQACRVRAYAAYFATLLERFNPALAFLVSYYNDEGMAFALACRRRGIPCIDLQHGFQGELHIAYGRWNAVPAAGYQLLPSHFWCWSQQDTAAISVWSAPLGVNHRPLLGGNLWLDLWRDGGAPFIAGHDKEIERFKARHQAKRHVLVTLQTNLDDAESLRPLLTAMRESSPEWFWWMRLHPCMLDRRAHVRALLQDTGNRRFEIDLATDQPLYALLRHMDLHATHCSSTVIEAREFGVPSIIFSEFGREFFPAEIAAGWARVSAGEWMLADLEEQMERRAFLRRQAAATRREPDALETVLALLQQARPERSPAAPASSEGKETRIA